MDKFNLVTVVTSNSSNISDYAEGRLCRIDQFRGCCMRVCCRQAPDAADSSGWSYVNEDDTSATTVARAAVMASEPPWSIATPSMPPAMSSPICAISWPRRRRRAPATGWPGSPPTAPQQMIAARIALADVPLKQFLHETVIPYEDDEVTRLIVDSHDAAAFAADLLAHGRRVPRLAAVGRGHAATCCKSSRAASRRKWRRRSQS